MNIPLDDRAIYLAGIVSGRATRRNFIPGGEPCTTIIVSHDRYNAAREYLQEFGHNVDGDRAKASAEASYDGIDTIDGSEWCVVETPSGWYVLMGRPHLAAMMPEKDWYLSQRAVAAAYLVFATPIMLDKAA